MIWDNCGQEKKKKDVEKYCDGVKWNKHKNQRKTYAHKIFFEKDLSYFLSNDFDPEATQSEDDDNFGFDLDEL